MLYYDRIDVYEGIDFNKTTASKECVTFVTIGIFYIKRSSFNHINATDVMIY